MATALKLTDTVPAPLYGDTRIGLVDIGSSSIRLVIYRAGGRLPHPQFNEREVCRLGAGVAETGRLDPDRIAHGLATLARYALIARHSQLDRLEVFATEAVRKATNQADFIAPAEALFGQSIRILTGREEAQYAALGVISGFVEVDGVVADLGGGSLELQPINASTPAPVEQGQNSLPIGHLNDLDAGAIEQALGELDWLASCRGKKLYAVGGTWRAIATAFTAQSRKRLDIVHGLVLTLPKLEQMMDRIDAANGEIDGIPPARRPSMRQAIKVMRGLVKALQPEAVVFSSYGAREGILYDQLDGERAGIDPLIAGVKEYADMWQRHQGLGPALTAAMEGFIHFLPTPSQRLARAASLLADISWLDFPDYRGPLAVEKMLGLSVVGITHPERIWMAAVLSIRYRGKFPDRGIFRGMLTRKERKTACFIGLALRMLMNLSGGLPSLLQSVEVIAGKKTITIVIPAEFEGLVSPLFQRRVDAITKFSPAKIKVEIRQD